MFHWEEEVKEKCDYWVLFFDLDGTLWDHKDVSSLKPPFVRINTNKIRDSEGTIVKRFSKLRQHA